MEIISINSWFYICICTNTYTYTHAYTQMDSCRNKYGVTIHIYLLPLSTGSIQILVSKYYASLEEVSSRRVSWKMVDSMAGTGKIQNEPGTSSSARK